MTVLALQIDDEFLARAKKVADLDQLSIEQLAISALRHHVEYISAVDEIAHMPPFSLDDYEMQRDPDELDAEYEFRLNLFR